MKTLLFFNVTTLIYCFSTCCPRYLFIFHSTRIFSKVKNTTYSTPKIDFPGLPWYATLSTPYLRAFKKVKKKKSQIPWEKYEVRFYIKSHQYLSISPYAGRESLDLGLTTSLYLSLSLCLLFFTLFEASETPPCVCLHFIPEAAHAWQSVLKISR